MYHSGTGSRDLSAPYSPPAPGAAEPMSDQRTPPHYHGQRDGQQGQPQAASRRFTYQPWHGPHERVQCVRDHFSGVEVTPFVARPGLARPRLQERDRTTTAILLCSGVHDGPCEWPGGHLAGELDEAREQALTEAAMREAAGQGR